MNIKKFAAKPKLIEVVLDSKDIVEKYEEPITFYTKDLVSMDVYMGFFGSQTAGEFDHLAKIVRNMILDQDGNRVLADDEDLPIDIAAAVIAKLGEIIGTSVPGETKPHEEEQDKG